MTDADAIHEKAWELIPWFVNGRLSNEDAMLVEAHLASCARCRDECAVQAQIHDAIRDKDSIAFASDASYRKLSDRIDASRERRAVAGRPLVKWLVAAVVVESVGLVAWGAWSWHSAAQRDASAARYVTLSKAAGGTASTASSDWVRVVFAADATLEDVQSLLLSVDARLVDGPTENGVYTIAFGDAPLADTERVNALRASPLVRFAEPVFVGTGASS